MMSDQITPASASEIDEAIAELVEYRERLLSETLTAAQRAKLPKSQMLAQLEPELAKIDSILETLRMQQANH